MLRLLGVAGLANTVTCGHESAAYHTDTALGTPRRRPRRFAGRSVTAMDRAMPTPIHCWIFDLDGTLTLAQHDFAGFKQAHGLPLDTPILEGIALAPPATRAELLKSVDAWEAGLATESQPAPDAQRLLPILETARVPMAVLTRNTRANALVSLAATGLARYFPEPLVIGRDEFAPKPSPDGVRGLLSLMGHVDPRTALMVGDHIDDVRSGHAAGTYSALLRRAESVASPPPPADVVISALDELLETFEPR